jgi:rRNA maturation RNase YbeY
VRIDINLVEPVPAIEREPLGRLVAVLNELEPEFVSQSGGINLKLVDDASIRALNKQYSGNDYATDVLSFSYIENGQPAIEGELGDMAISLETAARQAAQAGTSLGDEVATLALHGMLHIYGLDHTEEDQRAAMDKLQADILAAAAIEYRNFQWVS